MKETNTFFVSLFMPLTPVERDVLIFHLAFAVICALTLAAPVPVLFGWRVMGLVLLYNAAWLLVARWRSHAAWLSAWAFLAPLSALLILPDSFLAVQLQTLVFPDKTVPRVGEVPIYMGGMWTIPLMGLILLGQGVAARRGERVAAWSVLLGSFVAFTSAEISLPWLSIYYPVNVQQIAGAAVYVNLPISLLGLQTYWAYGWARGKPVAQQFMAALAVMVLYLGGLVLMYLLIERFW